MNRGVRRYYVSSFFWGTFSKLITAIINFISVPLLLEVYGNDSYGILSLAQAANAYIAILDLGMNTGAIKFFSEWRVEGRRELITACARSNITFYILIGVLNSCVLIVLAFWGSGLFNVTDSQFFLLKRCFLIIALFSVFNWVSAAFSQLLISAEKISFVNQMQCITALLNGVIICIVIKYRINLEEYFFLTVLISSLLLIPYVLNTIRLKLVDSFLPGWSWGNFKIVFLYSLHIFALSIFQIFASNSRPIILGIFSNDVAMTLSEYKIITVFPSFIIMVGGSLSTILLPKASKALMYREGVEKENIAYKGTFLTSILANILCIPVIFCAEEVISAYVGESYAYLSTPLIIWLISVLYQIHSTPCNSLILATGKTKYIVIGTAVSCIFSIMLNIYLTPTLGVMAAVVSYGVYVFAVISAYYLFYYKRILGLNRFRIFKSFFIPTLISFLSLFLAMFIRFDLFEFWDGSSRANFMLRCIVKSTAWGIIYLIMIILFLFFRRILCGKEP